MRTTVLRCWRCRHQFHFHGPNGCQVRKAHWDSKAESFAEEPCECRQYLGDFPDVISTEPSPTGCPHEVQEDMNPHFCVHCKQRV